MKQCNSKGVGRKDTSDSTSKKFGENVKKMLDTYSNSEVMKKDFNLLKSSERIKFLQGMAQYIMPKGLSETDSGKVKDPNSMFSLFRRIYPDMEDLIEADD